MMYSHTVTLYNKYREGREVKYHRTVLQGVHYESGQGVRLGDLSVKTENDKSVQIPKALMNNYVTPLAFDALESKDGKWTLRAEDILVKGEVNNEIIELADLKVDDVGTVKEVHDVDYGIKVKRHLKAILR